MTALVVLLIAFVAGLAVPAGPARAQIGNAATFLTPFPDNDRYRVQVWGDSMSAGLLEGLSELMSEDPKFAIDKRHRWVSGLLKSDADAEAGEVAEKIAGNVPHIVVMMLGAGDRLALRRGNRRAGVGSPEWKVEYARRLDVMMRAFRKDNVALFWLGLPVMRRQDANGDAETMNELYRSRALANGVRFIDIFGSFADPDKSYSSRGPDLAGKDRLLRDNDGVHFTWHGYRKLAYFVERELKRAAQQAWDERTIPLAGAEDEQARLRPATGVRLAPPSATTPGQPPSPAGSAAGQVASAQRAAGDAAGGLLADNSQVTLKSVGSEGRQESITIEILRPAIPATIVSMVTRRESDDKASQVGDAVMTEILGGLTVVSSVTPVGEAGAGQRRGALDTTSPLHRVLLRGETLPPKPGRSDDMPWPRPEPVIATRKLEPVGVVAKAPVAAAPLPVLAPDWDGPPLPRRPSWIQRR